jgi:hypothetical protein
MNIEVKQYIAGTKDAPHIAVGNWMRSDEGYYCSVCLNQICENTVNIANGHWRFCPVCGSYLINEETNT